MSSLSRGIAISTFGNAVPPLAALATQPLLAYGLGVVGRGELAAATAPFLLATAILTLGLPESLTFHIARGFRNIAKLSRLSIGTLAVAGLIGSALIALLADALAAGDTHLAFLISVGSLAIAPTLILSALRGIAAGRQAWALIAVERISNALLRLVAIAVMFFTGSLTPLSATIATAATSFAAGVTYAMLLRRRAPSGSNEVRAERPSLFRYAGTLWLGTAAGMLLSRIDQVLMTPLAGVEQLGYYAVAASISEVVLVFNSAVRDVIFAAESTKPDAKRTSTASRISTMLTAGAATAVALACPLMIPLLFGRAFVEATPIALVLLVGVVIGNPGSVAGAALSGRGRPGLRSTSIAIAAIVNIVCVFTLVPSMGAMGAAVATALGNLLAGSLNIWWLQRHFDARPRDFYSYRLADAQDAWSLIRRSMRRPNSRG